MQLGKSKTEDQGPKDRSHQQPGEEATRPLVSSLKPPPETAETDASLDESAARMLGTIVDGKYEVLELAGKGGMSNVYKARNVATKKVIALKIMHSFLLSEQNAVLRFQQEAKAASLLDHPHAIAVHDLGVTEDGQPYLIMDYLQGRSLGEVIKSEGKLEIWRCLHIFIQACGALAHAHKQGIVHRDMKPSNIMLIDHDGDHDFVKVVDFGIAKILPQEGGEGLKLTTTGEVFGSPLYMSPEQCLGLSLDPRSDIYSMGCLMYEALTGKPPLEGKNMLETLYKQINEMPEALAGVNADIRVVQKLDATLKKAMAKKPEERHPTMIELADELKAAAMSSGKGSKALAHMELGASQAYSQLLNKLGTSRKLVIMLVLVLTVVSLGSACLFSYVASALDAAGTFPLDRKVPVKDPTAHAETAMMRDRGQAMEQVTRLAERLGKFKESFYSHREQGQMYLRSGEWHAAITAFEFAMEDAPLIHQEDGMDAAEVHAGLARCYLETGAPRKAVKEGLSAYRIFQQLGERTNPSYLQALAIVGEAAENLGKRDEAEVMFNHFCAGLKGVRGFGGMENKEQASINNAIALEHAADFFCDNGNFTKAIDWYEFANNQYWQTDKNTDSGDSTTSRVLIQSALTNLSKGDTTMVKADLDRALKLLDQDIGAYNTGATWNQIGLAHLKMGQYVTAEANFKKAQALLTGHGASDHVQAILLFNLSDAQRGMNDYLEAVQNSLKGKKLLNESDRNQ